MGVSGVIDNDFELCQLAGRHGDVMILDGERLFGRHQGDGLWEPKQTITNG